MLSRICVIMFLFITCLLHIFILHVILGVCFCLFYFPFILHEPKKGAQTPHTYPAPYVPHLHENACSFPFPPACTFLSPTCTAFLPLALKPSHISPTHLQHDPHLTSLHNRPTPLFHSSPSFPFPQPLALTNNSAIATIPCPFSS